MSYKLRRFSRRSRSSNMFDPQRLLYSSTRTQKKARVLHPKSTSVSASTGLDSNQRNEIFNNIVSTRSYIFRPMSSNATTPWQSYQVYQEGNILCKSNPNESTLFCVTECSMYRGPGGDDKWAYPFNNLFQSFYPNSPFPFILNQIKFRMVIPLKDQEGQPYFNDGTDLDFKIPIGIYSWNGTLVETINEISITYTVHYAEPEEEEELPNLPNEIHLEIPFISQVLTPNEHGVILSSIPTSFIEQGLVVKTQSTPFAIDLTTKPYYTYYLDDIKRVMNTYKQFPESFHDQINVPLCIANFGVTTDHLLGFTIVNETPDLEYPELECRIILDFSSFSGIPAPRS